MSTRVFSRVLRVTFLVMLLMLMAVGATAAQEPAAVAPSVQSSGNAQAQIQSVELPRIEIWLDAQGMISKVGIASPGLTASLKLSDLQAIGIQAASPAILQPAMVKQFGDAGIGILELAYNKDGFDVFINNEPTVHLLIGENEQAITQGVAVAQAFGVNIPFSDLLPLVKRANADVVLYLPAAGDMQARAMGAPSGFATGPAANPDLQVKFKASVDKSGEPVILDTKLSDVPGMEGQALALDPTLLKQLESAGVKTIGLQVNAGGLYVLADGTKLLGVNLGNDKGIKSLSSLSAAFGGPNQKTLDLLSKYRMMDIDISVNLPQ